MPPPTKRRNPKSTNAAAAAAAQQKKQQRTVVDERVDTALQSLERGVQTCLRRCRPRTATTTTTTGANRSFTATTAAVSTDDQSTANAAAAMIRRVLLHIRHCWTRLRHNLTVLAAGMQCFREQLLPSLSNHLVQQLQQVTTNTTTAAAANTTTARSTVAIQVLQHVFQSMLRLHDGYILTVSGECRHAADRATAQQQQSVFRSRLNQPDSGSSSGNSSSSHRSCGKNESSATTTMESNAAPDESATYSTHNTYSGTSWDEWFDPRHGLRQRLYMLLRPYLTTGRAVDDSDDNSDEQQRQQQNANAFWDDWTELGQPAAPLEAIIVETEQQMKELQLQFTAWRRTSQSSSSSHSSPPVTRIVQRALERAQRQLHPNDDADTATTTAVKVTLDWTDKMEQLIVVSTLTGNGKLKLERYADTFQVQSGTSVLPPHCTSPTLWWSQGGMEWERPVPTTATTISRNSNSRSSNSQSNTAPTRTVACNDPNNNNGNKATTVKRRKIIADSSDEEETTIVKAASTASTAISKLPSTSTAATGLIVKVIDTKSNLQQDEAPLQSSVNDIKLQCGVNVQHMEAAFDTLQVEEAGAVREAELIDNAPEDASYSLLHKHTDETMDILQAEKRVRQRKRLLRKAIDHVEYTDLKEAYDAIWNARDSLREAMMQAGELILWSDPSTVTTSPPTLLPSGQFNSSVVAERERMLLKSIQYFDDASRLVAAQQKLHVTMKQESMSPMDRERAQDYRRNLLLLSGQARTNVGIATIELVRQCHFVGNRDRKQRLRSSCQILDGAIESAQAMNIAAMDDSRGMGSDLITQCRMDLYAAMQLEALALRWKATALWYLYLLPDAYAVFIAASLVYENECSSVNSLLSTSVAVKQQREINAALECRVECYHSLTTLADCALTCLKQATILQLRESPEKYEILLDFVDRAISKAAHQSTSIQHELGVSEQHLRSKEVIASDELLEYWNDVQAWWDAKKEASSRNILKELEHSSGERPPFKRSEFSSSLAVGSTSEPSQRFLAWQPVRRQSKYNLGGVGFSNAGNSATNVERPQQHQHQPPRQYRKWREDMILDKTTGKMISQLNYPSIAPEMPSHIRAIYDRKSQNH